MSMHTEICEKSGVFSVEERKGVESDMVKDAMSVTVKLAMEIEEPDINSKTCGMPIFVLPGKGWLHDEKTVLEVTLECRESGLTGCSTERAVVRKERSAMGVRPPSSKATSPLPVRADCADDQASADHRETVLIQEKVSPQSDETAGFFKLLKDEMSADLTAFMKNGLDVKTITRFCETHD